jgi:DNA polymerase-3 subunit delta
MIQVFYGENSFELERALSRVVAETGVTPEKIDGEKLGKADLPNILQGASLFEPERLVIVRYLSDSAETWEALAGYDYADNDVILVEGKIDKRSKTYKHLKDVAEMREFLYFFSRDFYKVQEWVEAEIASLGLEMNKKVAQHLVNTVGQNQWQLAQALDKLSLVGGEITAETIDELIDKSVDQNVFAIFENALSGQTQAVVRTLNELELTEDVYRLFGLLTSQVFNLAALVYGDKTPAEVAKDLGVSPYALGNLSRLAREVSKPQMHDILQMFLRADEDLKTTSLDSWLVVKNLLVRITKI